MRALPRKLPLPMPNRIDQKFAALRAAGRKGLIAYICAGDPNLAQTKALCLALEQAGVDLLELGVPTLGMEAVGERRETLGDVEARLTVGAGGAALTGSNVGSFVSFGPC